MKKIFGMFLLLLIVFSFGCSRQEPKVSEDIETTENQEDGSETLEGWQYQGEKQAYLWGTWSVTMVNEHWGTLEILPDRWSFKSENPDYSGDDLTEQFELCASPFLTKYRSLDSMFELEENYCLEITLSTPEGFDNPEPCTQLFLVNQDFMVGFTGRAPVVLERKEAYAGELENGSFIPEDYGFWRGDWEVTEAIKADGKDVGQYIGMQFHTDGKGTDREEITGIYIVAVEEESIEKLVEVLALEDENFVIFCEFSENCFWDTMIMKDERNVILEKDNLFFWAERISAIDEHGEYGVF